MRPIFTLLVLTFPALVLAEWEGVPSEDYAWWYNTYLALLWIGLPLYILGGWLLNRWRDRRSIRRMGKRSP